MFFKLKKKAFQLWDALKMQVKDESGIGTVEIILILVVLVALVLLFKKEIMSIANSIFTNISNSVNKVY